MKILFVLLIMAIMVSTAFAIEDCGYVKTKDELLSAGNQFQLAVTKSREFGLRFGCFVHCASDRGGFHYGWSAWNKSSKEASEAARLAFGSCSGYCQGPVKSIECNNRNMK